jgi:GNAT superfamily N-acetyltransferase
MSSSPPEGFRVRPATVEDAPAINELVIAADVAVQGWSDSTAVELVDWWRLTDLAANSWVVEDDLLAAYGVVISYGESAETDGFVHPDKAGLGLGSWLLRRGEDRVRELGYAAVLTWCLAPDIDARVLFERSGYREVRRFYRMLVEHEAEPPPAEWPEGFRVTTFEPGDARAFHAALSEAFAEEWNFAPQPFEEWAERRINVPDFDPTLWFIVREGNPSAAAQRGSVRSACAGAGADAVSASGSCGTPSRSSTGVASLESGSESTRRTRRAQRVSTSVPACTSHTRLSRSRRSSPEPPARQVPRLQDVHGGRARARVRVSLVWTRLPGRVGSSSAGVGRGR